MLQKDVGASGEASKVFTFQSEIQNVASVWRVPVRNKKDRDFLQFVDKTWRSHAAILKEGFVHPVLTNWLGWTGLPASHIPKHLPRYTGTKKVFQTCAPWPLS